MVDQSELLFKLFADYCSDRTADTPVDHAPSQLFPRRYWASLLIKVLVGSQEEGRRNRAIQASATLSELAILLDRCKRQGKMDANSLKSVFSFFRSLILVRSAVEEKTADMERASGDIPPSTSLVLSTSKIGKSTSNNKSSSDNKRKRNEDTSRGSSKAVRKSPVSDGEEEGLLHGDDGGEGSRGESVVLSPRSLRALLLDGWVFLKRLDRCEGDVFAEEVTLPDYRFWIPDPMDLSEIKRKINRSLYTSLIDIHQDVLLMFRNCVVYNHEGTVYAKVHTLSPLYDPSIDKLHRLHLSMQLAHRLSSKWTRKYRELVERAESGELVDCDSAERMAEQLLLEATLPSDSETALSSSEQKVLSRLDDLQQASSATGGGRRNLTLLSEVLRIAVEFLAATDSEKLFAKPVRTAAL